MTENLSLKLSGVHPLIEPLSREKLKKVRASRLKILEESRKPKSPKKKSPSKKKDPLAGMPADLSPQAKAILQLALGKGKK